MKQTFFRRPDVRRRIIYCRPHIDALEARLVLGDALLGLWALGIYLDTSRFDPESIIALDPNFRPWVAGAERSEVPAEERSLWHRHRGFEDSAPATRTKSEDQAEIGTTGSLVAAPRLATAPVRATSGLRGWHEFSSYAASLPISFPISFPNSGLGTAVRETPFRVPTAHETEFPARAIPNASSRTSENVREMNCYGDMPLSFEANHGQTDSRVDFIARTGGYTAFLTPTAAVFSVPEPASVEASARRDGAANVEHVGLTPRRSPESTGGVAVHMQIVGANPNATPAALDQLPGIVNYFIGNDPSQWHADIPTFGRVKYQDVYPGIDLAYYGNQSPDREGAGLEYDFIVSPGADPNAIALNFAGADGVEIDPQGNLIIHTAAGDVVQQKPYLYQDMNGTRQQVAGEFRIQNSEFRTEDSSLVTHHSSLITFNVGSYHSSQPLVIDPLVLGYSTYLGGGGTPDYAYDLAVDGNGNAYVTGETRSVKFPATPGAFDETYNGGTYDAFVAKLNADGSGLAYASFLGSMDSDQGRGIALNSDGDAYVIGAAWAGDFPTTPGAFDTSFNSTPGSGAADVFVVKLTADGTALDYATFLGTAASDIGTGIALDADGNGYLIGGTSSDAFPTTPGAFDMSYNSGNGDGFVAKLNPAGSALMYSTYLGGSDSEAPRDIVIDIGGNAFIATTTHSVDFPTTAGAFDESYNGGSNDVVVTKVNPDGTGLVYSTYLGGSNSEGCCGIAVDASGAAYIGGSTSSPDFPTSPGAYDTSLNIGPGDGFLTKFNSLGTGLVFSTLFGGSSSDGGGWPAVDNSGNVYLVGATGGSDFPTTSDAFDKTYNGDTDVVLLKFNATGSALLYSSFLGGSGYDFPWALVRHIDGTLYVTGTTDSGNFPTTSGALKRRNRAGTSDVFVTKFAEL